jgi:hypothetical protein
MRHLWLCIAAFVLLSACDRAPAPGFPAAPSPAPTSTPPPSTPQYTLSGVVRGAGIPVAGATVALLNYKRGAGHFDRNGSNGSYGCRIETCPLRCAGEYLEAGAYRTRYIPMSQDRRWSSTWNAKHISVDGHHQRSRRSLRCASLGYGDGDGSVSAIALTVPESGTLEVAVSSEPASPSTAPSSGRMGRLASIVPPLHHPCC